MNRAERITNVSFDVYCEYPNPFIEGTTKLEIKHCATEEEAQEAIENFKRKCTDIVRLQYLYSYTTEGIVMII